MYIYIYMCVCVCVCICIKTLNSENVIGSKQNDLCHLKQLHHLQAIIINSKILLTYF